MVSLSRELGLSVATMCHQTAPVGDICGLDLEIVKVLNVQRCLESADQE
jgi:hypothetical protein